MSTLIAASSLTFFQNAQPKNRSPSRFYGIRFGRKPKLCGYQIREPQTSAAAMALVIRRFRGSPTTQRRFRKVVRAEAIVV